MPFNKFFIPSAGSSANKKPEQFNLFVKCLPRSWTHEHLNKAFERFGNVASVKVSIDANF